MATAEQGRLQDMDPTAGALHCFNIKGRYLVRVQERQRDDGQRGYVLAPIQDITHDLIPLLGYRRYIKRDDFLTRLRTGNVAGDSSGRIYDVRIKNAHITEAIEQVVEEGRGLVLVSGTQIANGNGTSMFGTTHEISPIVAKYNFREIEAIASTDCRRLFTPKVSTKEYRLSEGESSKLYTRAKRWVYSLEGKGSGSEYRLNEADIKMLRKCGDSKLVDDLERTIIVNRLILAGLKILRGIDEGMMVGIGGVDPHAQNAFRLISIAGLIATHAGQVRFEKRAVHSVAEAFQRVLHNIVASHKQEVSAYGKLNSLPDGPTQAMTENEKVSWMAEKLSKAEQVAPFVTEMGPNFFVTTGVLGINGEITPVLANLGLAAGTYIALQWAGGKESSKIKKFIKGIFTELGASAVADIAAIVSNLSEGAEEGGLLTTDVALIGGHASKVLAGVFEMEHGREALGELRNWLQWLDISLVSKQAKKEHCLGILATEDTGLVFDAYPEGMSGPRIRRYQLLGETKEGKISSSLLIKDLTVRMGENVILENTDLHLERGVYVLCGSTDSGQTAVMKCLADKLAHPTGTLLLRQVDSDVNIHGEPDKEWIQYLDCSGKEENGLPDFIGSGQEKDVKEYQEEWERSGGKLKKELEQILHAKYYSDDNQLKKAQAAAAYLQHIDIFTHEEIINYFTGENLSSSARSRFWLALAGWNKSPVVLLDNLYAAGELGGISRQFISEFAYLESFMENCQKPKYDKKTLAVELRELCRMFLDIPNDEHAISILRDKYLKIKPIMSINNFIRSNLFRHDMPIILLSSSEDVESSPYHEALRLKAVEKRITIDRKKLKKA